MQKITSPFKVNGKFLIDERYNCQNLTNVNNPINGITTYENKSKKMFRYENEKFIPIIDNNVEIYASWYGCIGDGKTDNYQAIQSLLDLNKNSNEKLTIIFERGIFNVSQPLRIYSNTSIKSQSDTIFKRTGQTGVFMTNMELLWNEEIQGANGYEGEGNISIIGGQFDMNVIEFPTNVSVFPFCHAENILFKDITVINSSSHVHEFAGCKNIVLDSCKYKGYNESSDYNPPYLEIIQPDQMTKEAFPYGGKYDGTVTNNITIKNCVFSSLDGKCFPTAIGNHGSGENKTINNITIENNTFEGFTHSAIEICKFSDVFIRNNNFINCNHGIYAFTEKTENNFKNIVIENNNFNTIKTNEMILMTGLLNNDLTDSYFIDGVRINNNIFKGTETTTGISLKFCKNTQINNNIINIISRGVVLENCENICVCNNNNNSGKIGFILAWNKNNNISIENNTIVDSGETPINVYNTNNLYIENNIMKNVAMSDNSKNGINSNINTNVNISNNIIYNANDSQITNPININSNTNLSKINNIINNQRDNFIDGRTEILPLLHSWNVAWEGQDMICHRIGSLCKIQAIIKSGETAKDTIIAKVPEYCVPTKGRNFIITDWNSTDKYYLVINTQGEIKIGGDNWDNTRNTVIDISYIIN